MVSYLVYLVTGKTSRGTGRGYVGFTRSLDVRKHFHRLQSKPCWMRPWLGETEYVVLREGLENKAVALAEEAILAAKAILQKPCQVRGGPWSSPKPLSETQLDQVRRVSLCSSLVELKQLVGEDSRTALARHLLDLDFCSQELPSAAPEVMVRLPRSSRSGTPGNEMRKRLKREKRHLLGTKRFQERLKNAHRGKDPSKRRALETEKRPSRSKKLACVRKWLTVMR